MSALSGTWLSRKKVGVHRGTCSLGVSELVAEETAELPEYLKGRVRRREEGSLLSARQLGPVRARR